MPKPVDPNNAQIALAMAQPLPWMNTPRGGAMMSGLQRMPTNNLANMVDAYRQARTDWTGHNPTMPVMRAMQTYDAATAPPAAAPVVPPMNPVTGRPWTYSGDD